MMLLRFVAIRSFSSLTLMCLLLAALLSPARALAQGQSTDEVQLDDKVQFNRDIRPLLSSKCYHCHGPDEHDREADLRLDKVVEDLADRGVVVPGNAEESELIRRVVSTDPDEVMPPPAAKLELTPEEIKLLRAWVEQGGEFEGHWAFIPPEKPMPPTAEQAAPVRNAIDVFVQKRLEADGLKAAGEADRRTLIRRATLDLWGLPPTPEAIEEFLADPRPDAYEHLIDRLLDSPRYGERMTVAWMDAARYGDTSVFHADGPRDMWPWRDWVLRAYNTNMPFDQFTVEQLAGDLLPNPTTSQLVATGFNRNHGTTDEGGAIDEEYRVEYIVDRVKTTSMIWLGLTMECAQCHDHKYDPITQEDYYRFFAFFNQTPEKGMQTRNGNAEPRAMVPSDLQTVRLESLKNKVSTLETAFASAVPPTEEIDRWIEGRLQKTSPPSLGTWHRIGPFKAANLDEAFGKKFGPEKKLELKKKYGELAWQEHSDWQDGNVINFDYSADGDTTYLYRPIESKEPTELDLSLGSDDTITVWVNGKEVHKNKANRGAAADQDKISVSLKPGKNDLLIKICNNNGPTGFYFKTGAATLPEKLQQAIELAADDRNDEQKKAILDHYRNKVWEQGKKSLEQIAAAKKARDDFQKTIPTVMVMKDMQKPRMTFILERGSYDAPKKDQAVKPRTPSFLPQFPEADMESRLGLAKWLTSDRHPLTARVAVNRYWTQLFGQGIVSTVADFGSQGAWPSHPELLDYLARDFVESGWDVKRMIRKIVTSHTYRQSSRVSDVHLAKDPLNTLLARSPRLRLPAEFIRDNALSVAGLLVEQVGGPGVKPYQPPGLWNEVSLSGNVRFKRDTGEKLYRRTMYTYWKRSSPQPAMMTFDVPTREKCVIQRQRTNTPLQALVTLNDEQFVEAARCFAERILESDCRDDKERLDMAFELSTGRRADSFRHRLLTELLQEEHDRYKADEEAAVSLLSVGEVGRNESLDAAEHAAWTIVASAILNLDETLNKE